MRVNRTGLVVCMGATALLLAGCEKKVGGQVIAVVNGQEITQNELNSELNGQQIPAGADRKAVMRQLLQRIVDRKLLVDKAKQQGLDKSPDYLAQVQRAQDTVLIDMLASNAAKGVPVPDAAAAGKFMANNPSLFSDRKQYQLDQLVFPGTVDATLQAKLKPAKTMAAVEAVLNGMGITFQRTTAPLDTATLPPAVAAQIAALPPGEPFVVPQNGQVIVSVVKSVESVAMSPQQAQPAAVELLRRQAVEQAMRKEVDQARANAKISYAPDYAPKPATTPATTPGQP